VRSFAVAFYATVPRRSDRCRCPRERLRHHSQSVCRGFSFGTIQASCLKSSHLLSCLEQSTFIRLTPFRTPAETRKRRHLVGCASCPGGFSLPGTPQRPPRFKCELALSKKQQTILLCEICDPPKHPGPRPRRILAIPFIAPRPFAPPASTSAGDQFADAARPEIVLIPFPALEHDCRRLPLGDQVHIGLGEAPVRRPLLLPKPTVGNH